MTLTHGLPPSGHAAVYGSAEAAAVPSRPRRRPRLPPRWSPRRLCTGPSPRPMEQEPAHRGAGVRAVLGGEGGAWPEHWPCEQIRRTAPQDLLARSGGERHRPPHRRRSREEDPLRVRVGPRSPRGLATHRPLPALTRKHPCSQLSASSSDVACDRLGPGPAVRASWLRRP